MSTSTISTAKLEGIYRCGGCRIEDVFGVGDPMPACACGETDWNCWVDDNAAKDAAFVPICFWHGTMSFVFVKYGNAPELGNYFNIRLKTRFTTFDGKETRQEERYFIDARYEVRSVKTYSLNGHPSVIVEFAEVAPVDIAEFVYQPMAAAW